MCSFRFLLTMSLKGSSFSFSGLLLRISILFVLFADTSDVLQDLDDMNERYVLVGDRLTDRKTDLEAMMERVRAFRDQMTQLASWLDSKVETSFPQDSMPSTVEEARRKLAEHQQYHSELLGMAPALEDLKDKAIDLLKNRDFVPGVTEVKEQLGQLEKKWAALQVRFPAWRLKFSFARATYMEYKVRMCLH